MKLTKLLIAAALTAAVAGAAQAETWRMASKMPVDSPEGKVFSYFAERVAENTNGALTIQVFPNEQLGQEDAVLEQLQAGVVNIYAEGYSYMRKWVPELSWTSPLFVFDDYDHWVRFMKTDLVTGWFDKAAQESGVGLLGDSTSILRGPFRVMVSNRPVNSLADVAALKLRMYPDKTAIAAWSHLGAEVITLPWTDVYQSISKDIVQAVNSPVALVESMRFQEVAPYIAETDEFWQSIGLMMNLKAYEALDEPVRQGLLKAYDETAVYSKQVMYQVAEESLKRMQDKGATYVKLDTKPFVERMKSLYKQMEDSGEMPEGFMAAVEATRAPN